jgi:hypothetical protein
MAARTLKRGKRVAIRFAAGKHTERATVGKYHGDGWYVVAYDSGGRGSIHIDSMSWGA